MTRLTAQALIRFSTPSVTLKTAPPERTATARSLFVHSPTLIIVAALFAILVTGVLYAVWHFNRGIPGLRLWTWSFFAMGTFAVNLLLRDFSPQGIAAVLAQISIVASAYLCWLGSRAYMGRKPLSLRAQVSVALCAAGFLLLSAYFTYTRPNQGARFVLISVFLGFFFLMTARTMAKGGMHRVPARYLFAAVVGGHGLFLLIRPVLFQLALPSHLIGADNRLVTLMSQFVVLESIVAIVLIAFGVLGTLCTWPILSTLQTVSSPAQAFWLVMAALVILSGYTAINAVVKAEMFPVEIRALGVGLPYALTVALFGGTADMVALWFKKSGMETGFYGYVTACIACSLLVYLWMPDTRTTSLIDRDPD